MSFSRIDREVQAIKQEILEINRELGQLEEAILYPPKEQLLVFLSMASDAVFDLRSLRIELNGQQLVDHRYGPNELDALEKGGVHRTYAGRIRRGQHLLKVNLTGSDPKGAPFDLETSAQITNATGRKLIQLHVDKTAIQGNPKVTIHDW